VAAPTIAPQGTDAADQIINNPSTVNANEAIGADDRLEKERKTIRQCGGDRTMIRLI
jgi:hypothetical protein